MMIQVAIVGPDSQLVEMVAELHGEGDLALLVKNATLEYRKMYPDAVPFDYTIKVSRAS